MNNFTLGTINDWIGAALVWGVFIFILPVSAWVMRLLKRRQSVARIVGAEPGSPEPDSPIGSFSLFGPTVAKLKGKANVPGLIYALYNPTAGVRQAAAEALGHFDDPRAVESLIVALGDPDPDVRQTTIDALGTLRSPRAVDSLVEVLEESDSVFVSRHAADALGNIGDPRAVPILTRKLRDSDPFVRLPAIDALGKIGDRAATQALIRMLKAPEDFVRGAAANALGEIADERAVSALARALNDPDRSVRDSAAGALGEIGDPSANEFLVGALRDRDWAVRGAVAGALNETKWIPDMGEAGAAYWAAVENWSRCVEIGRPAVNPLSEALRLGTKEFTRAGAAEALGTVGESRAADSLVGALNDGAPLVRKRAAEALERLGWVPNRGTAGAAFWATKGRVGEVREDRACGSQTSSDGPQRGEGACATRGSRKDAGRDRGSPGRCRAQRGRTGQVHPRWQGRGRRPRQDSRMRRSARGGPQCAEHRRWWPSSAPEQRSGAWLVGRVVNLESRLRDESSLERVSSTSSATRMTSRPSSHTR